MRTTIDLPEALHAIARSLAAHRGLSLSQTVVELIERGLAAGAMPQLREAPTGYRVHAKTGLPVARSRRVVTPEDVAALDDPA